MHSLARALALVMAFAGATLTACSVHLPHPTNATILCQRNADCPAGQACIAALGTCVPTDDPCIEPRGGSFVPVANGNQCPLASGRGICNGGRCRLSTCGDGIVDTGANPPEQCDDGDLNNDLVPDACRMDCTLPRCGDGVVDTGEQCDDGNDKTGDGCRPNCTLEVCGDGILDPGEVCDDGNNVSGDGCRSDCRGREQCGDGLLDVGEVCDDGNTDPGGPCSADCLHIQVCGNGVVDGGECCDAGGGLTNQNPNDGCDASCQCVPWQPATPSPLVTGAGRFGTDATAAPLHKITDMTEDRAGNTYVATPGQIWEISPQGNLSIFAGTGTSGTPVGGGLAAATTMAPSSVAFDSLGNAYVASQYNILRVCGDPATCDVGRVSVFLQPPDFSFAWRLITDVSGNLYISDSGASTIDRYCASGVGGCTVGSVDVVATLNNGNNSANMALSPAGDLYFVQTNNAGSGGCAVYRLCLSQQGCQLNDVSRVVGAEPNGATKPVCGYTGDGGPATAAEISQCPDIAFDRGGNLYLIGADNARVRKVCYDGVGCTVGNIETIAGSGGPASCAVTDFADAGLGGPPVLGGSSMQIDVNPNGDILVASGTRVQRLCTSGVGCTAGTVSCLAGSGTYPKPDGLRRTDLHTRVTAGALAPAPDGGAYVSIAQTQTVIHACGPYGTCTPGILDQVAGTGAEGFSSAGGAALSAQLGNPQGLATDATGNVFIADDVNDVLWKLCVDGVSCSAGTVSVVPQTITLPSSGGSTARGTLISPADVVVDSGENIYIAEAEDPSTTPKTPAQIRRICGNGIFGCTVGAIDAPAALQVAANALALDGGNNLYLVEKATGKVGKYCVDGVGCTADTYSVIAGGGTTPFSFPNPVSMRATDLQMVNPTGIAVDSAGNVYISDRSTKTTTTSAIYKLCVDGVDCTVGDISVIAGNGAPACTGDGGPAIDATLDDPGEMSLDGMGNLLIADGKDAKSDQGCRKVRRLCLTGGDCTVGYIDTYLGGSAAADGPLTMSALGAPAAMAWLDPNTAFIADGTGGTLREVDLAGGWLNSVAGHYAGFADGEDPIYQTTTPSLNRAWYDRFVGDARGVATYQDQASGKSYVVFSEASTDVLRRITLDPPGAPRSWPIETWAGAEATPGYADAGPNGDLSQARFDNPGGLAFDAANGLLYVADTDNHVVRAINVATGNITLVAGTPGAPGSVGENVPPTAAFLRTPDALALGKDAAGTPGRLLYVAERINRRVRLVDLDANLISTVIGPDVLLRQPRGLAVDRYGNLFVSAGGQIWRVAAGVDGEARAGDDVALVYGGSNADTFPQSSTACLTGLSFAPGRADDNSLYVLDECKGYLLRLDRVDP